MLCTGYDFLAGNPPSADLVYHWACLPRKQCYTVRVDYRRINQLCIKILRTNY